MKYVWTYVNGIEVDAFGVRHSIWSEERDIPYDEKQLPTAYSKVGTYKFDEFTIVVYCRHGVTAPRSGWKELAFILGKWHFDSI